MIHIWQANPQAPLRVWQDTTQSWQLADNWQAVSAIVNLQVNSKSAKAKQACLYFPTMYLLRLQPELTAAQLKTLGESGRQYLFEEISIAPVDDLQVKSHHGQGAGDFATLFALHASDRDQWMQAATLSGIEVVALLPDFMLLPAPLSNTDISQQGTTAVFYQDTDTQLLQLYQQGMVQGMAVNYLPLILVKQPNIESVYLTGQFSDTLETELSQLAHVHYQRLDALPYPVTDPIRQFLNFAVVKRDTKVPPYLKVITMVLTAALLTSFVVEGLRWYYYQQATKQAKLLLEQQYNQWFPNEKLNTRSNLQRQLASKLVNQQSNQTSVLTILSSIQPILRQYQITTQQLNFQNNRVQLQLVANNADSISKAVSAMSAQGVNAKLGTVTPNSNSAVAAVDIGL